MEGKKRVEKLASSHVHVSENAFQRRRSPPSNHAECEVMPNYNWDELEESASDGEREMDLEE